MVNHDNEQTEDVTQEPLTELTDTVPEPAAEEPELETIESLTKDKLQQLREKVTRLDEEKKAVLEELALAKADFLNARKRLEEEKKRGIERQKITDIEALLPLCDAFTMAMADTEQWQSVDEAWRQGVEGIYHNLQSILKGHNVETYDPTGESFDPELHEALSTTDSDQASDVVVSTMQQGYKMGDVVIRPAKVVISS